MEQTLYKLHISKGNSETQDALRKVTCTSNWEAHKFDDISVLASGERPANFFLPQLYKYGPIARSRFCSKLFLAKKGAKLTADPTLIEDDTSVTDSGKVANIMTHYYIHIADHSGTASDDENLDAHSIVIRIKAQMKGRSLSLSRKSQ